MSTIIRNIKALHPLVQPQYVDLQNRLALGYRSKRTKTQFKVFETFRTPMRQDEIFASGKFSKASAYRSAHQYGLAADFVPFTTFWSWDEEHDYDFLREAAKESGLDVPYKWDRVHVEHPDFNAIRAFVDRNLADPVAASKAK